MAHALDVRLRALLAAGRHVVLAGDFNVAVPWWDNSMRQVRAPSISRSAASRAGAGPPSGQHRHQHQQQRHQAQGQLPHATSAIERPQGSSGAGSGSSAAVGDLVGTQSQQQQAADRLQQQAQDLSPAEPLQAASRRDNLAPLAHYRRGKVRG